MTFEVKHNLDQLSPAELREYLDAVSIKIGLDPSLNALDTIWLPNPTGQGRSLVVYARRGTCEILRNIYEVEVVSLTYALVEGSIVFTAVGPSKKRGGRQEIAIGSKYVNGLTGRELDSAIMTASTRALNRLTMQFTELGILAESEVVDMVGDVPNPAGSVQLAANPTPPMYAAPTAQPNEAPGKVVADEKPAETEAPKLTLEQAEEVLPLLEEVKKVSKPKKKRGEVVLDVEPETVSDSKLDQFVGQREKIVEAQEQARVKQAAPTQADVAAPTQANPAMPTKEQMDAIKATLNTYTQQLAPSEGMPAMIKMRAFITRLSDGVPPQSLTMPQWEGVLTWFSEYEKTNGIKATLTHINETLGVK